MLTLSFWAKNHPLQARWLIAVNRILLGILAYGWGMALVTGGNDFSKTAFIASAVFFIIAFFGYPRRRQSRIKNFTRQKCCDALLVASSCLFWLGAGNYLPQWASESTRLPVKPPVEVVQSAISKEPPGAAALEQSVVFKKAKLGPAEVFQKVKTVRERFFQKIKHKIKRDAAGIRQARQGLKWYAIALLVLASLAITVVLGYLTVAVSCGLSCNGHEGAAIAVLILGVGLIAGAIYWMWSAALKKNRRK